MTAVRTGTGLDEDAAVVVWQAAQAAEGRRSGGTRAQRVRARLRARDALLLVAERGGAVVGVLLAELTPDDGAGPRLQVGLLAVDPPAQRSGVGRALLGALLARYPSAGAWVGEQDEAAQGLHRSAGFVPTGSSRDGADGRQVFLRTAP